ncbi:MAG: imelysin family protein [Oleispira sp.]
MKKIVLATFTGLSVLALAGCGSSSSSSVGSTTDSCAALESASFSCKKMLNDIVDHTVEPLIADFSAQVQSLKTATSEYCASIDTSTQATELVGAQEAWQATMDVWQQLEVMQFGPLLTERENFYSWPLNDSCKVDEEVVFALVAGYDIGSATPARRGLDAFEYLVFNSESVISCGDNNTTPALIAWNAKDPILKLKDRCAYATMVSDDLVIRTASLTQAYIDYDVTVAAGSQQKSANLISDALFYIDKKTKDDKLVAQLPQTEAGAFNPGNLEFNFASASKEAIHNNLKGALAIMDGTNGNGGLGDYLVAVGQSDLAEEMISELNIAIGTSSTTNISTSFRDIMEAAVAADVAVCINAISESATTDLAKMCGLDNDIKAFTDDLKNRFVLTLGFSTPTDAEGDND